MPLEATTLQMPMKLAEAEEMLIKQALEQSGGNISEAAPVLGTNRPHIYRVIRRLQE